MRPEECTERLAKMGCSPRGSRCPANHAAANCCGTCRAQCGFVGHATSSAHRACNESARSFHVRSRAPTAISRVVRIGVLSLGAPAAQTLSNLWGSEQSRIRGGFATAHCAVQIEDGWSEQRDHRATVKLHLQRRTSESASVLIRSCPHVTRARSREGDYDTPSVRSS